jgi:hypothetical protein
MTTSTALGKDEREDEREKEEEEEEAKTTPNAETER